MDTNPYEAPRYGIGDSSDLVSERIVRLLLQTKPWVRFFSVLGYIATGIMVLGCVFGLASAATGRVGGAEALILLLYLPMAVVYYFASLHLGRYASRIRDFAITPRAESLESALAAQRSFWRLVGIMAVVFVLIYVLAVAGLGFWTGFRMMP